MSKLHNILAGLGGAVTLNLLHESLKEKNNEMPRVDLLGEEALSKALSFFGIGIRDTKKLYQATLASDVISNSLYYSLIGLGSPKYLWPKAVLSGLSAGIGAVTLPKSMGLDDKPVAKHTKTKVLTITYYLAGALVTALIFEVARKQ